MAALGDAPRGPAGTAALRSIYETATREYVTARNEARSEYCDLACASVWALAKRDGPAATDIYAAAARSASAAIRDYGASFLALADTACDGDRRWVVYADRIAVRPAAPPPAGISRILDPAWLLTSPGPRSRA